MGWDGEHEIEAGAFIVNGTRKSHQVGQQAETDEYLPFLCRWRPGYKGLGYFTGMLLLLP